MDGRMDGRMDGQMDGWTAGWLDGLPRFILMCSDNTTYTHEKNSTSDCYYNYLLSSPPSCKHRRENRKIYPHSFIPRPRHCPVEMDDREAWE